MVPSLWGALQTSHYGLCPSATREGSLWWVPDRGHAQASHAFPSKSQRTNYTFARTPYTQDIGLSEVSEQGARLAKFPNNAC